MVWTGTGIVTTTPAPAASSKTLSNVMLDVAQILGGVRVGTATGGSTTTLIDTYRTESPDYWADGILFILSGDNAGFAIRISGYGNNTIQIPVTLSVPIAAGVMYAVSPKKYSFDMLFSAIQRGIDEIGSVVTYDESLAVTASTNTYTLPAGVSGLMRVEVATSATAPYSYAPNYFWQENNGYLYFDPLKAPSTVGMKIRLWYRTPHIDLTSYSTVISPNINIEWLIWLAVINVYRDLLSDIGRDDPIVIDLLNQAMAKEREVRNTYKNISTHLSNIDPKFGRY